MNERFNRENLGELRAIIVGHVLFSMRTALEAVRVNKLRAGLTSLGFSSGSPR